MSESGQRVVFLSGDLMFTSRVGGAAKNAGFDFYFGGNFPDTEVGDVRFVILDLATRSKLTDEVIPWVQSNCPDARVIAYGPHVHAARLEAATAAGFETVLTRGQFNHQLPSLFS